MSKRLMLALLGAALLAAATGCSDDTSSSSSSGSSGSGSTTVGTGGTSGGSTGGNGSTGGTGGSSGSVPHKVIVFVWDGLRPDSVTAQNTPNLAALKQQGTWFSDNHSTYPTFTMMNAAALATGSFPGETGFYGNTQWVPDAGGADSSNNTVDFAQPAFTEDYGILKAIDSYYSGQLLMVGTLFQAAHAKGLVTAAIGKSGPAFLQDHKQGGLILDEKFAWPKELAVEVQNAGYPLPSTTRFAYADSSFLFTDGGSPTANDNSQKIFLADGKTYDASYVPVAGDATPYTAQNKYLVNVFANVILPNHRPDLSLIWLRNPDSTEHNYGPGSSEYLAALKAQDDALGLIIAKEQSLGMAATTDILVVSDHAHSSVSGPFNIFPPRALTLPSDGGLKKVVGDVEPVSGNASTGYSVSGDVRIAELMATSPDFNFANVFDGSRCPYDPVLSGVLADGGQAYPTKADAADAGCGVGIPYTTHNYVVPATRPSDAIVVAANGGSDYLYVPSGDRSLVLSAVKFLQGREEVGAIFVADEYFTAGDVPGALKMSQAKLQNAANRNPDIIFSYDWDDTAVLQGLPGIEFESMQTNRGMHGSFSPRDVHNTFLASGPDFRTGYSDELPTGNVDVAPTIAYLLGLGLNQADGRPVLEALSHDGADASAYSKDEHDVAAATPASIKAYLPIGPAAPVDASKSQYTAKLHTKTLTKGGASWTYFDYAKAVRQ